MSAQRSIFPPMSFVARGSAAEKAYQHRGVVATKDQTAAIVPGIHPSTSNDLVFHGGKTIAHLTFVNFYVGGAESWAQSDRHSIDKALASAMQDQWLNNVLIQYFNNQPISTTFAGSQFLAGPPPAIMSQGDIKKMLDNLYRLGQLSVHDLGTTVFNFMLPRDTVLNDDAEIREANHILHHLSRPAPKLVMNSLNGLGGYHGSIHPRRDDGSLDTVYYAVGVYSEKQSDGLENGIAVFDQPWKNIVATFYHELNEVRTNADVEDTICAGPNSASEKHMGWVLSDDHNFSFRRRIGPRNGSSDLAMASNSVLGWS